jgi:hypothetical protein
MFWVFLCSFTFAKALTVNSATFNTSIIVSPATLVFFTSPKQNNSKLILSYFNKLADKYRPRLGVLIVNIETSPDLATRFSIVDPPHLSLFRDGKLISHYFGSFTFPHLSSFCENILNSSIVLLNSTFDVFEFQSIKPLNLLISGESHKSKAESAYSSYRGAVAIGYLTNKSIIDELILPPLLLSRPEEDFSKEIESVSEISNFLFTNFTHIQNEALFGRSSIGQCLQVVLDENDPLQLKIAIDRFQLVQDKFENNMSYQYCDWFTCPSIVQAVGLATFQSPLFVVRAETSEGIFVEPFRKRLTQSDDVVNWLRRFLLHEILPQQEGKIEIPRLFAHQFISIALDPKVDVILLIGTSKMPTYEMAQQNVKLLIECFKDIPTVKFYEFNIETEHVPGLEIRSSKHPLLSIWPANEESRGSTFEAYQSIPIVLDQLLNLISTQISDLQLQRMAKSIETYLEQQEL